MNLKLVKNSDIINKNPKLYSKKLTIIELEKLINKASYLYYGTGNCGLTDNSFDTLVVEYKKRLGKQKRIQLKVGAPTIIKEKVKLPYPMMSLNKIKPGIKTINFIKDVTKLYWSIKLDGISGMIEYKKGKVSGIYTRGNGIEGGNITYLREYIKLPILKSTIDCTIRGEFVLPKNKWNDVKDMYASPRHMVCSLINSKSVIKHVKDIDFVAFELVKISIANKDFKINSMLSFEHLKNLKFNVVINGVIENPTTFNLISIYKNKRLNGIYQIDGLVLTKKGEKINRGEYLNPRNSVAFKVLIDEQIRKTKVIDIIWSISRHGRCNPVIVYETVFICGCSFTKASAHNANYIRKWNIGKGTKVEIVRSGDVIPQIHNIIIDQSEYPNGIPNPIWPDEELDWEWKGKFIFLKHPENNSEVLAKRLYHFFSILRIPRMGPKTCEKFVSNNMKYPINIMKSTYDDFIEINGVGRKTAENFTVNIKKAVNNAPIDRFLVASSIMNLGRKMSKIICIERPELLNMSECNIRSNLLANKIKGIGPKKIEIIAHSLPQFKQYLNKLDINRNIVIDKTKFDKNINNKKFILTGFYGRQDYELEDYIYDNGGDIVSNLTPNSILISANICEYTNKTLEAERLKIPIYSVGEFKNKYIRT